VISRGRPADLACIVGIVGIVWDENITSAPRNRGHSYRRRINIKSHLLAGSFALITDSVCPELFRVQSTRSYFSGDKLWIKVTVEARTTPAFIYGAAEVQVRLIRYVSPSK
jgi:hypothetical protein